jgi:hypothetical protein
MNFKPLIINDINFSEVMRGITRKNNECTHNEFFTIENMKTMAITMPNFYYTCIFGQPKEYEEVALKLLFEFSHKVNYKRFYPHSIESCHMDFPFDHPNTYSGETAPYCGHSYSGTVKNIPHYFGKGKTMKEKLNGSDGKHYKKRINEDMDRWLYKNCSTYEQVEVYFFGFTELSTYIPEVYDSEDYVPPSIQEHIIMIEKIYDTHNEEYIWRFNEVSEEYFDFYRMHR